MKDRAQRQRRTRARVLVACALATIVAPMHAAADVSERAFEAFDELLREHVRDGHVDYGAFARADAFGEMVDGLASAAPARKSDRAERLAFYINAYNALSIKGILDGYSPSSIWSRLRFFKRRKYELANTELSLYEIEHERIIPEGDARIHFAIVCASASCPPLRSGIFRAETLDAELDAAARQFVNDPDNNTFDKDARRARLSRIFDWFREDFERDADSLAEYLARYVNDPALAQSLREDDWDFDFRDYDWSLNGSPP